MAFLSRRSLIATGLSFATAGGVGYVLWPRMDGVREEVDRQRRLLSADPGLEELVRMATLAPNGHNTQPWRFQLGERTVAILPDVSRRTPVVDPDDHHLFVSLGCATENLVIAAAALGRGSEVQIGAGAEPAIEIALAPARPGRQELYRAIPLRQSTRSLYDGQAGLHRGSRATGGRGARRRRLRPAARRKGGARRPARFRDRGQQRADG